MSKITINNRDFCRVGSMFLHVVGTNPARETIIGAGAEQILDVFDGGEAINIICAPNIVEEVMEDGVMVMRNKPIVIEGRWFDPNLPQVQPPQPLASAKTGGSQEVAGKNKAHEQAQGQEGQGYQIKESTDGSTKPQGGKPSDKVNLTGK